MENKNEKKTIIKLDNVYLCGMENQISTVLLWEGNRFILERNNEAEKKDVKKEVEEKKEKEIEREPAVQKDPVTETLQQLVNERNEEDLQVVKKRKGRRSENVERLGPVVARSSSGNLINKKPLDEMLALRERGEMTPQAIETILERYHPDVKPGTLSCYKSGYKTYIENPEEGDVRSNTPLKVHETVTDRDINRVKDVLRNLKGGAFDDILKHLDMTDYKLTLILKDFMLFERYEGDGKTKYRLA